MVMNVSRAEFLGQYRKCAMRKSGMYIGPARHYRLFAARIDSNEGLVFDFWLMLGCRTRMSPKLMVLGLSAVAKGTKKRQPL
jgi:hypothetical protein